MLHFEYVSEKNVFSMTNLRIQIWKILSSEQYFYIVFLIVSVNLFKVRVITKTE